MSSYIPFDHPNLALIKCIQGQSAALTLADIDRLVGQLYRETRVSAEYIFVCEADLRRLDEQVKAYCYWEESQVIWLLRQYRGVHVVPLPTLPEGIFLVGVLDSEQKVTPQGARLASMIQIHRSDR